jgi:cytochrome P450
MAATIKPRAEIALRLRLSQKAREKLVRQAARSGQNLDAYASKLLERAITQPSTDELLAPFRKQVAEAGMSDEELDAFHEHMRDKVWDAKQGRGK